MAPGDPHFLEMGRLAHEFALLEGTVAIAIWGALGDINSQRFRAATAGLMWSAKLQMLRGLVAIAESSANAARRQEWESFFRMADNVATERNRILHSPLMSSKPGEYEELVLTWGVSRSVKNLGGFEQFEYTPASIQKVSGDAKVARAKLLNLLGALPKAPDQPERLP